MGVGYQCRVAPLSVSVALLAPDGSYMLFEAVMWTFKIAHQRRYSHRTACVPQAFLLASEALFLYRFGEP